MGIVYRATCSAYLFTVMLSSVLCERQAMTADDQQQIGAGTAANFRTPTQQPSASLGMESTDGPQQRCADTAAMEALRQLQLVPTTLHGELRAERPSLRHGFAADHNDCGSPLSLEAVARLCCDDEETEQQQPDQQVGSPQRVLGLLHVSRGCPTDGIDSRAGGKRTLPASGLGCGIFGASAVWGL